jgi:periplasmic protein TonB
MSTTTVNAFPPFHAFTSSRSWFLALIVLVHVGFFYGLSNGLTVSIFKPKPPGDVFYVPSDPPKPPPRPVTPKDPIVRNVWVPTPTDPPVLRHDEPLTAPRQTTSDPRSLPPPTAAEGPGEGPLIVEPELDARYPFSEPEYPVSEIRQGHEGTVLLALQILPNGRVGEVRIEQSSGYEKLDLSAAREARKWRMKPGTSNGKATAMWKKVPIKFQLKN